MEHASVKEEAATVKSANNYSGNSNLYKLNNLKPINTNIQKGGIK
jgi:hypothetical protein